MAAVRRFHRSTSLVDSHRSQIAMRFLVSAFLIIFFGGMAYAGLYRLIINPTTGNLDEVLNILPGDISTGQCLSFNGTKFIGVSCGSGTVTTSDLLLEDGTYLLLEDGTKLILN